jgi:CoA:oxalate CoA-transferase
MADRFTPLPGPLNGVTVVDLTRVLAGPYCTMILADLGAEVIKVETPDGGDDSRSFMPIVSGRSAYFMSINRGKKSVALNLKNADDRAHFEKLLERADVLVENFRGGTMEKLGYGWDTLHARFPRLIYAAVSGFGHTGPYAKKAAYDMIVQAMSGVMSITGTPGGPPVRVGVSIGDITAGLFCAIGVNAALYHRAQTGEAQKIDIGMLDAQVAILENAVANYFATGQNPGPLGTRHGSIAPFAVFEAADGPIVIAAGNDTLFTALCGAIGKPALAADPRFATNEARVANVSELTAIMNAALASKGKQDWLHILDAAGVPCGPINTIKDVVQDPQIRARNMIVSTVDPVIGGMEMPGNPIKLSAFPDSPTRHDAPDLDEDREDVLAGG